MYREGHAAMPQRLAFDKAYWHDYLSEQESKLPILQDVEVLSDRVVRILGGNPGHMQLQGTNTYIIGTGTRRALVDTGEGKPCWIARITKFLSDHGIQLEYVLLTHWHGDHTGGVADLVANDDTLASKVFKNSPEFFQREIIDGQVFHVEGATLRSVFTPGHANDHMCFVLEEERSLFTGDNVLGHGYSVMQDLGIYIQSLRRMAATNCLHGYPGHGAYIRDLPSKIQDYIQHKETRIDQTLKALLRSDRGQDKSATARTGGMTVTEIIGHLYGNISGEIVDRALVPLLNQILWKLAEDLKVGFEPGDIEHRRWFVRPSMTRANTT